MWEDSSIRRLRRCKVWRVGGGGWEVATTYGIFFLFSSRLSDIEVKISFDLEVCFFVMSEEKQAMHAGSLFSQLDQFLWLTKS